MTAGVVERGSPVPAPAPAPNTPRVLLSAYACQPGRGSEPGVGWNVARAVAMAGCEVWVLTMTENREAIEAELSRTPAPNIHPVYWTVPRWIPVSNEGVLACQVHYHVWQIGAYLAARRLRREVEFDVAHHVTFVRYWSPSFVALLPIPFVWGPVGGGESAPRRFWPGFGWRGIVFEACRALGRWIGEHDPFVRITARRSALALATTKETAERLRRMGARDVRLLSEAGLTPDEISECGRDAGPSDVGPLRVVSIGRLIHWKGFHLAMQAFARAQCDGEYWIVGGGPEEPRLKELARELGVSGRVRFCGALPRAEAMQLLRSCDVLVHPSLHDSGGWVCLEAMAAGRPVVCLSLGGPATQVTEDAGIVVDAADPERAVAGLAAAFERLAGSPALRRSMGAAGQARVADGFTWDRKARTFRDVYAHVTGVAGRAAGQARG